MSGRIGFPLYETFDSLEVPAKAAAAVCLETHARLLLGGGANWPPTRSAVRFLTLIDLARSLDEIIPKSIVA